MTKDKKLTPEEQSKQDEKDLKRLLDSYTMVAKHKLGRPPNLEDLTKMLSENEGQEKPEAKAQSPVAANPVASRVTDAASSTVPRQAPQQVTSEHTQTVPNEELAKDENSEEGGEGGPEPKILHMKIYYGMSGENEARKPDPHNILYYQTPDNRWYDTKNQCWTEAAPLHAEHLPSRPIEFHDQDILAAIAHGVMDDEDFETLDKADMIANTPKLLWEKMSKLRGLYSDLAKSEEIDESEEGFSNPEDVDPDLLPGSVDTGGADLPREYMKTAGVSPSPKEDHSDMPGEDLIKQIMDAAVAALSEANDERIRTLIRAELQALGFGQQDLPDQEESDIVE